MKSTIITVIFALTLYAAGYSEAAPAIDQKQDPGFPTHVEAEGPKVTAIPEAGAVVLGLVGAMLLLCRRRS